MSSKRRKLITNSKPTGADPRTLLTEGVRSVLQSRTSGTTSSSAAGVGGGGSASSTNTNISVDEALASNPHIHEPYGSYEQAIRTFVQGRINTDPDFCPERYPNCTKWINKKK